VDDINSRMTDLRGFGGGSTVWWSIRRSTHKLVAAFLLACVADGAAGRLSSPELLRSSVVATRSHGSSTVPWLLR
jgi:hypothetical protein